MIFNEDNPLNKIKKINPDFIKGGDYNVDTVVGNEVAGL